MEQIPLNIKKKAFCAEAKNCQNQFSKLEAELWYSWHSIKTQAQGNSLEISLWSLPVSIGLSVLRLSVLPWYSWPPRLVFTCWSDSFPVLTDLERKTHEFPPKKSYSGISSNLQIRITKILGIYQEFFQQK